jgi:uncharacterized membrane protein
VNGQSDHSIHVKSIELERLVFFSDAVFAIAITLLVLELRMPERLAGDPDRQLVTGLVRLLPRFASYAISFWLIGLYWWVHHRMFRHIRKWDDGLIWLNFHFLFWIAFLPFPVGLVGSWGDRAGAVMIYAGTLVMVGVGQALLWRHAARGNRLLDPHFDREYARFISVRSYIPPVAAMAVLLAALWQPRWAWFGFWLIFLLQGVHRRRNRGLLARVAGREAG